MASAPIPWSERSWLHRGFKNGFSGLMAGAAICLVGHPFDTVKVRLAILPPGSTMYTGLTDCFIKTIKWEGISGFYKGVASPLVGAAVLRSVIYGSYLQFVSIPNRHAVDPSARLTYQQYLLCGAATGVVCSFFEGPIDLFKTKLQAEIVHAKHGAAPRYRNVFDCGWQIARHHGVRGVFQGLGATLIRNIPSNAVFFAHYELGRDLFIRSTQRNVTDLSLAEQMSAGLFAGLSYWLFTYPTDVVKSAMQADDVNKANRKYHNSWHCAKVLYADGGWRRFFRGYSPCLMRCLPSSISLLVLETCRKLFP